MPATAERERGVTLTECCVSIAIAAIIAAIGLPSFADLLKKRHLEGRAGELSADLQLLRTEAVARNATARITLGHGADGDCYVLYVGDAGACGCEGAAPALCEEGAQAIKSVFLPADGAVRLTARLPSTGFHPVRGNAVSMNRFVLTDDQGREVRHTVSHLGRVLTCSTASSVGRYAPC